MPHFNQQSATQPVGQNAVLRTAVRSSEHAVRMVVPHVMLPPSNSFERSAKDLSNIRTTAEECFILMARCAL